MGGQLGSVEPERHDTSGQHTQRDYDSLARVMFCPSCRAEYQQGVAICPDCEIDLVEDQPAPELPSDLDLVSVFETADVSLLPVIKSLLQSVEIPFLTQGDEALGVLPVGRAGAGGLTASGHGLVASILVVREREQEARDLLADIVEESVPESEPQD